MKKFLLFCFLLPQVLHSQNQAWEFQASKGIGTLIPHTSRIRHLLTGYETPYALSLFQNKTNTQIFLTYFPSHNPIIGSSWALTPTHKYFLVKTKHYHFSWLGGAGIAKIQNPFNQTTNPKNIAIGTPWNVSILTGFQSKFYWKNWSLGAELFAQHASNGSFKKPNLGLNYLNGYLSIGYSFSNPYLNEEKITPTQPRVSSPYSTLCAFANQANLPGGPTSLVVSSQTGWTQMISDKRFFTLGFDLFADGSNQKTLSNINHQDLPFYKTSQIGIQLGYGFWGNQKLAAFVQQGFYLVSFQNLEGKLYQKIGVRRELSPKIQFVAALKTHFAQADNLEFGFLYQWKP